MGGKTLVKNTLVFGIILLFIVSAVSPMVIGLKSDTVDVERDEFLDNLAFYCYDEYGSSKSEHYKEYFQRDNLEIADLEEITIPIESPQTSSVSSGPMDSPWPMYCHDVRHTGRSPYSTASNPGTVKWKFRTEYGIDSSPAIDENGTIYIGSNEGYLHAINSNGTEKWRFTTNFFVTSSPAIAEDGTIYVGSWDDYFYAIYSNGTLKWRFYAHDTVRTSPAIAEDGTVYFGVLGPGWDKGRIHALNPNGTEKWYFDTGDWVYTSPAIGMDGTVYCSSNDKHLYALNSDNGTLKWNFKRSDYLGSPAIEDDGTVYIPCWDGYLYAIFPNGTMRWKSGIGWGSGHTPSIAKDGTIYIGGDELYAIYPNGTRKWAYDPGQYLDVTSVSHAISADGTIYIGVSMDTGYGGDIIAINPDGTEKWRERIHNERVWSSPAIGSDGTVYIGTSWNDFGVLHAFGELDSNAPDAPTVDGLTSGKSGIEYEYNFTTTDPNGDDVYYYIEWGDGAVENWIGPYGSGEKITVSHTWDEKGDYTIKARAKDTENLWGSWGYLEVTMPMNQQSQSWWFLQFLQNHPRMFPILRQLLGL